MPASDAGSSERRTSHTRSARQLVAQVISAPCSASAQTPSGVLGWLRSLGRKRVPVQSRSPDDGAPGLMVGAKCRVVGATYANGWLIIVGANKTSPVPGNRIRRRHARRRILPSFGALRGDNTPTAALRGLRMVTRLTSSYKRLLELFGERMKKGKACLPLLSLRCLKLSKERSPLHGCPGGLYRPTPQGYNGNPAGRGPQPSVSTLAGFSADRRGPPTGGPRWLSAFWSTGRSHRSGSCRRLVTIASPLVMRASSW